ncbi:MAG: hypothetical protein EOP83_25580, partial [Verrucomicrobiaceae bacterium]
MLPSGEDWSRAGSSPSPFPRLHAPFRIARNEVAPHNPAELFRPDLMKPTLLVLAAGMGSRYGGLKQMDPM